jgi:single-stranded DNA-binding protein
MDYTKVCTENTNLAVASGRVASMPTHSHQVEGENFYEFKIEVERLSKIKDIIPVTVSERTLLGQDVKCGDFVKVSGEYRSYNKLAGEKSRLVLHFFAKEISKCAEEQFFNEVKLTGYICKEPIYRKTPFNREICDVLLAVNRTNYHKSDYVPCILWGRNARFVAGQNIGCKVEIIGRIQSREYNKVDENGQTETKTAYEVSCQRVAMLSNITPIKTEKTDEILADASGRDI